MLERRSRVLLLLLLMFWPSGNFDPADRVNSTVVAVFAVVFTLRVRTALRPRCRLTFARARAREKSGEEKKKLISDKR